MKKILCVLVLLLSFNALAEDRYGMNNPAIQQMMVEMQKYQACLSAIDQSKYGELEGLQQKFEKEVSALCASGARDKAQQKAISFGKEISRHPVFEKIRQCTDQITSPMAKQEIGDMDFDYEKSGTHVCDEMN